MLKRMLIMLIAVAVVFGAVFGFEAFKNVMIKRFISGLSNPPQTVSTMVAKSQLWSSTLEAVGSARAINGVNLSAQVAGTVSAIHFTSDSDVKQGTLLLELSAADDVAHLDALKATTELARITYDRDKTLLSTKAVSQQTVDSDKWALANDEAQVAQQQALVDYKFIKAPFSGRIGIRLVDLGQYIAAGTTIAALQQLDPIFVDFYLPQQSLAKIKVGQQVAAKVDTYPGANFAGEISAVNSLVDTATRNVQVRATLKNPDGRLLPGMFITVDIDVGTPQNYVTLPQTAIAYNSFGNIVYIVEDKGKDSKGQPQLSAKQTFVTTGATRGDQVAVLTGVKDGDTVVTAGQVKLRNGTPIIINNAVQPSDNPNPKPVDQ
jgi:membrane fusion protein (multidrug efflux system)